MNDLPIGPIPAKSSNFTLMNFSFRISPTPHSGCEQAVKIGSNMMLCAAGATIFLVHSEAVSPGNPRRSALQGPVYPASLIMKAVKLRKRT
jgi:hypothetical protein